MVISASQLRQNIYRLLDEVLESGEPIEIERNGRRLRIVPAEAPIEARPSGSTSRPHRRRPRGFGPYRLVARVASVILLDTHVVLWLSGGERGRIPASVQRRLNSEQLGVSPFVQLEIGYLQELGRIRYSAQSVIDGLRTHLELVVADVSSAAVCSAAVGLKWTRDPFDRLLAAHATAVNLPLVTGDETIRRNLALAWWG